MRRVPTRAEGRLWEWLRDRRFDGYKFRRQYPVGQYILDFYCPALKLAIEADGQQHEMRDLHQYDEERERFLRMRGIEILRIPNVLLIRDDRNVIAWIQAAIDSRK